MVLLNVDDIYALPLGIVFRSRLLGLALLLVVIYISCVRINYFLAVPRFLPRPATVFLGPRLVRAFVRVF